MKISQVSKKAEALRMSWIDIQGKIDALKEQQSKVEIDMNKLHEICSHPKEKQHSDPVTGEECGVCGIDWSKVAEAD